MLLILFSIEIEFQIVEIINRSIVFFYYILFTIYLFNQKLKFYKLVYN
jgi:hypothetical protein